MTPRKMSTTEIVERLVFALVNEGRDRRGEDCSKRASTDIDMGLPHRLRLPAVPRWTDELRRQGRACTRSVAQRMKSSRKNPNDDPD